MHIPLRLYYYVYCILKLSYLVQRNLTVSFILETKLDIVTCYGIHSPIQQTWEIILIKTQMSLLKMILSTQ